MTGVPLSRHLGRTLPELLPQPVAQQLEDAVLRVFVAGEPVHDLEVSGQEGPGRNGPGPGWSAPIRCGQRQTRCGGRAYCAGFQRAKDAVKKPCAGPEKLAATGRLAASIAHEINNPLEAITNLLFLLHNFSQLEGQPLEYVLQAEHEARRISEITQQTLRFYRQPRTPPAPISRSCSIQSSASTRGGCTASGLRSSGITMRLSIFSASPASCARFLPT